MPTFKYYKKLAEFHLFDLYNFIAQIWLLVKHNVFVKYTTGPQVVRHYKSRCLKSGFNQGC